MSSEPIITASGLGKCYHIYDTPRDRLLQMLFRGRRTYYREFWALRDVSFTVHPGEVLGIVGKNGAGKSTLLQLVCGTLNPTSGSVTVRGRIAALLELGAGFNPEFTGRENVFLSAAVMGLSHEETEARYQEIVAFSGIGDEFIDQPVKTYSSGMYVRLAFSVAASVDPDILIIDEALSVGDGEFARKSFDRIMQLRAKGATILFCSHSMYHIEAICNRAIWLDRGTAVMYGEPARVVNAFSTALVTGTTTGSAIRPPDPDRVPVCPPGTSRIESIEALANGQSGRVLSIASGETDLVVRVGFVSDPELPAPSVAVGIISASGQIVTSGGSYNDGLTVQRDRQGRGCLELSYPRIQLLKGEYTLSIFLGCEKLLHIYDYVERHIELIVHQRGLEQGMVTLPHVWRNVPLAPADGGTKNG